MTGTNQPSPLTCEQVRDLAAGFVLDALDADDAEQVRAHLATCPEAHEEIAELAGAIPVLTASVPQIDPSPALKGRVMAAATADLATGTRAPAATAPAAAPAATTTPPEPTPISRTADTSTSSWRSWVLGIAAVLAIALLGGWNLLLQGQLDAARSYERQVAAVVDAAGQPGSLSAIMSGEGDGAPSGLAAITADGTVTLAMQRLPATSGDEVYEAWSIAGDGVPVPLGGFTVDDAGVAYFEGGGVPVQAGVVLALTREPGPGAVVPAGPVVSSGTATAAG